MNACGKTRFKVWTGRSGEVRVYVMGKFCRGVSRAADGAYFVQGDDGTVAVALGQGEKRQAAAEIVARDFGFIGKPFAELVTTFATV